MPEMHSADMWKLLLCVLTSKFDLELTDIYERLSVARTVNLCTKNDQLSDIDQLNESANFDNYMAVVGNSSSQRRCPVLHYLIIVMVSTTNSYKAIYLCCLLDISIGNTNMRLFLLVGQEERFRNVFLSVITKTMKFFKR